MHGKLTHVRTWSILLGVCALAACSGGNNVSPDAETADVVFADVARTDAGSEAAMDASAVDVAGDDGTVIDAGMDVAVDAAPEAAVDVAMDTAVDDAQDAMGPDTNGCGDDSDCSDGVFCNGVELCRPGDITADARGCIAAPRPPCPADAGTTCDESLDACVPDACSNPDQDSDGVASIACGGADCDDADPTRAPGITEVCNGVDDNCDGQTDEGVLVTFHADADGDTFGSVLPGDALDACTNPAGYVTDATDCDDTHASVHPGAAEVCDALDNECNGTTDDEPAASAGCAVKTACYAGQCVPYAIVAGGDFTCASHGIDRVSCWGDNLYRQVDTSSTSSIHAPEERTFPVAIASFGLGNGHGCAAHPDGTVGCWGNNQDYQVTADAFLSADPVRDVAGAVQVVGGLAYSCALLSNGQVKCWGDNLYGQLGGSGYSSSTRTIAPVRTVSNVVQIAAHRRHSCAVITDGTVMCWGPNDAGDCGTGNSQASAVVVAGISDAVELAVGDRFSCARRTTGGVMCWGDNTYGTLGIGDMAVASSAVPLDVMGLTDIVELAAGDSHICARHATGAVSCWGNNANGKLGNGTTTVAFAPVTVTGLTDAIAIAAGASHSCARRVGLHAVCWGSNLSGQRGVAGTANALVPASVDALP